MTWLDWLPTAWALLAAGFTTVALVRLALRQRRLRRSPRPSVAWPPVLLLRPVDAPTPHEASLWAHPIDYPAPVEHVVVSPAPPVAEGLGWLRSTPTHPNRKVGHLALAAASLPLTGRVVLSVDADVRVDGALVRGLVAPLLAGAAVAAAAPEPEGGTGPAAALWRGLLVHSHHSFVALAAMRAGAPPLCGKALALTPEALGVLTSLADFAGEDLELARRLHGQGAVVQTVAVSASCPLEPRVEVGAVLRRTTRWMQVLLAQRPGLAVSLPLLLAPTPLLALLLAVRPSWALLVALTWLVLARSGLAVGLGLASRRGRAEGWTAWPAAELLQLVALARAAWGGRLVWRGRAFRLLGGGRLVPLDGGER